MHRDAPIIRVTELNLYIKSLISSDSALNNIRVAGEMANFKHHRSGHMYFSLRDKSSSLRCVFFRHQNRYCPFRPEDGMEVVAAGSISVYEPDGQYQLYVTALEPSGLGSLFLAFEQLKAKLEQEGLFRQDLKKEIPLLPGHIALVTAPGSAALEDMLTTIQSRFPRVVLTVVESLVQGPGAPADIAAAIDLVNSEIDADLIIIARGGGSLEDLLPFNSETVARAIFKSDIPVISGVGHETDYTIADFVADLRAPTPTAAATAAVPDCAELEASLEQLSVRARRALQERVQREIQYLDQVAGERFFRLPRRLLAEMSRALVPLVERLEKAAAGRISLERRHLQRLELSRLRQGPQARIRESGARFEGLFTSLKRSMIDLLRFRGLELGRRADILEGHSPLKIMNRGYSFCRDEDGRIVRSVKQISAGSRLRLGFSDGQARCRVEQTEEGELIEKTGQ